MVLGIALGVSVVVSIDLANASAGSAFRLSTETLTGKATHQISGGPRGVSEDVFHSLRLSGWDTPLAPVVSTYVTSAELGGKTMQLLGIDPFSDGPFHSFLGEEQSVGVGALTSFLSRPGAVLISRQQGERYGLAVGAPIEISLAGRRSGGFIAGYLDPSDNLSRRALEGVILADIATAQELTGTVGWLSRIDLILPGGDSVAVRQLEALLPTGYRLARADARTRAVEEMTEAFRVNLSALSLLALVVGLFLIYNTMTFSVVQRRALFGTLRCLGVSRREVFLLILCEAALVGVVGALIGLAMGVVMGRVTVGMVAQTINDLYFTTTVQETGLPAASLLKGGILGVLATVLTAALPAWEAASIPPRAALLRSGLEDHTRRSVAWAGWGGLVSGALAWMVFQLPTDNLLAGFGGTLLVVLAAALIATVLAVWIFRLAKPVTARLFGFPGRMAPRNLLNALSRTAVATIALMIAVAVTVGISIMIDSFRGTVVLWLEETLGSDVYISAPIFTSTTPSEPIGEDLLLQLQGWPGVKRVDTLRSTTVQSRQGQINLAATENPDIGFERKFISLEGQRETIEERLQSNNLLMSEPLAYRLGITAPGAVLELNTGDGWQNFRVIGIYYDYASSEGTVLMGLSQYRRLWRDESITAVGLHLQAGWNADEVTRSLQDGLESGQTLLIRANSSLRQDVMMVFDRTFAITIALRFLATVVAFIGVLSALFLLQIEKQREVGVLRAIGLSPGQLQRMVLIETGLMGLAAGILALPTGYALALILIHVINKRSFGWTLQLSVDPWALAQGVLVALGAALIAGVYPALRLSRIPAAEAIRYE
jgi:putative ABC transport system permease protein